MWVCIIAARDTNNGIAKGGKIPWTCPADMKHFASTTRGSGENAVLMGRATWDTIARPLPGRLNLVMTRSTSHILRFADNAYLVPSFAAAHEFCMGQDIDTLWVCGGGQVYRSVLDDHIGLLERCVITTIDKSWGCDTFFPELCGKTWKLCESFPLGDESSIVDIYSKQ